MRLINTVTLELHEFFESQAPPYVILSHTWEKDEITFQEMVSKSPSTMVKAGYKKIQDTCKMAQTRGQQWAWIDTCCIDKSSSAELTESINSMYRWYQNAHECYAYLVDFTPGAWPELELGICRWFKRGFTLQELIAPKTVILFDRDWNVVGEKGDNRILEFINRITRVSKDILLHRRSLSDFAIAERMLWASSRETTRPEDKAYCLLGIFEVNMPLIYGEGDNAFRRLQEEIIKRSNDLSIFLWGEPLNFQPKNSKKSLTEHPSCNLFATSPADFGATWEHMIEGTSHLKPSKSMSIRDIPEFTLTNKGLNFGPNVCVIGITEGMGRARLQNIYYTPYITSLGITTPAVFLQKIGPGLYVRLGVRILMDYEPRIISWDNGSLAVSAIANTIIMDHRTLSKSKDEIFEHSVSIRWSSDLHIKVSRTLPHTHWDASRSLFFPPWVGFYGQVYEIACVELKISHLSNQQHSRKLYVIIDFCHMLEGGIPRAFLLGEDDLPEITSLIQQSHIPRHVLFPVLFPGYDHEPGHLLNKGPQYGRQKVITLGTAGNTQTVVIGIEAAATNPPAEFEWALGRVCPKKQYTVILRKAVKLLHPPPAHIPRPLE